MDLREFLTPREYEILSLISQGMTNLEITEKLFIAETTLQTHITSIYTKLGIRHFRRKKHSINVQRLRAVLCFLNNKTSWHEVNS